MPDSSAVDQNVCRYPTCQDTGGCRGVCRRNGYEWARYLPYSGDKATEWYDRTQRWNDSADRGGQQ